MEAICKLASPLGLLTLSSDGESITGLWLENQKYAAATLGCHPQEVPLAVFDQAADWLAHYFAGDCPSIELPLAPLGSSFRQEVWAVLRAIPYGQLTTYGAIARQLEARSPGRRVAAQAVGGAVGHNPISILIPCHRVVGCNGSLTGYAGGLHYKCKLLELEKSPTERLFVPKKGSAL